MTPWWGKIETKSAPIRYLAELLGVDTDSERANRRLTAWSCAVIRLRRADGGGTEVMRRAEDGGATGERPMAEAKIGTDDAW